MPPKTKLPSLSRSASTTSHCILTPPYGDVDPAIPLIRGLKADAVSTFGTPERHHKRFGNGGCHSFTLAEALMSANGGKLSVRFRCRVLESRHHLWQRQPMKHGQLCAIGHNLADSMASGLAFVIGYHPVDVFGEAAASSGGLIEIDFLRGSIIRGAPSLDLSSALRFADRLPSFCNENGADVSDFTALSVTFQATPTVNRAVLYVADRTGHRSATEYAGIPLKRLRVVDRLGRVRRSPRQALPARVST
jgi:hypothetical protein